MKPTAKRCLAVCGAALCLVLLVWLAIPRPTMGMEVRILDVGQGSAALLRTAEATVLIDAGANAAEAALVGTLHALDVERIDLAVFTHPDEDHIGGGDYLLDRIPVTTVVLAPIATEEACFTRLVEAAVRCDAEVQIGRAGTSLTLGGMTLTFLAPLAATDDPNAASLVTRIDYGETAILSMGDADTDIEAALLAADANLTADLLILGHHGANTSTSDALLDAVTPIHAAISCGANNTYGHPARRVIDALEARGIPVARTDREGHLCYRSDGAQLRRG